MKIILDNLTSREIAQLLQEHLDDMHATSPPESVHALDLDALRQPGVSFWSVYDDQGELLGCGALKELDKLHGEIKSMRTSAKSRGKGVASFVLLHIIDTARSRGYRQLSLETGSMAFFEPARKLYLKHGFNYCGPFGSYENDPNSNFMTLQL